jgi:galactose oxidase
MNSLCFMEMTDGHNPPVGNDSLLLACGNWTETTPAARFSHQPLPSVGWTATSDSSNAGHGPENVLKGDENAYWQSVVGAQTASITIDMSDTRYVSGLYYLPQQDKAVDASIDSYEVSIAATLDDLNGMTGSARIVAQGNFSPDISLKKVYFKVTPARYVRLAAQTCGPSGAAASMITLVSCTLSRDYWTMWADQVPNLVYNSTLLSTMHIQNWFMRRDNSTDHPHWIVIDRLGRAPAGTAPTPVTALCYTPIQPDERPVEDYKRGNIGRYTIDASDDQASWSMLTAGSWEDDQTIKLATFSPTSARYIRLTAATEAGRRGPFSTAADLNLLDGSCATSSMASSDFGAFIISRANFFDRYLLPKLSTLQAAMEVRVLSPTVSIDTSNPFSTTYSW